MLPYSNKRALASGSPCRKAPVPSTFKDHTPAISVALLSIIVLSTQFLPSLPVYFAIVSSRAGGMIGAACIAMLVMGFSWQQAVPRTKRSLLDHSAKGVIIAFFVILLIVFQGAIVSRLIPLDVYRLGASLIPLLFLISGAIAISSALDSSSAEQINAVMWISFSAFMTVIALRAIGLQPRSSAYSHPAFPFSETSHFALAFGPVYLYRCVRARNSVQYLWIIFGLVTAILLHSATLLAFAGGGALLCRKMLFLAALGAIPFIAGAASHLHYFTSRADISSHSSSISALVYLQGWEFIIRSLRETDGLGLGFQQLGVHSLSVPASALIRAMNNGKDLNTMDGSFLFSKLASEMGVIGIALGVAYLVTCWKLIRRLRSCSVSPHDVFAACMFVGFGIDMFVRGIDYFYGGPLLFLGAFLSLPRGKGMFRVFTTADLERSIIFR